MKNLNSLMDHILYQIFKIILNLYNKKAWGKDSQYFNKNYINKIENRVSLKIKTRYYLELLTPQTIKLLGSTKSKETKDQNGKNVPCIEITKVVYR